MCLPTVNYLFHSFETFTKIKLNNNMAKGNNSHRKEKKKPKKEKPVPPKK